MDTIAQDMQSAVLLAEHVQTDAVNQFELPGSLEAEFDVDACNVLGTGMSGEVRLATCRTDGTQHAVKTLHKTGLSLERQSEFKSEVDTHLSLDHPNIARLERVFETQTAIHLVMEHLEGGEVFDRLASRHHFSEGQAAETLMQALWAVSYLHAHKLAHLDLKLENLLYESNDSEHLKLIDFGFTTRCGEGVTMTRQCGSLHYVAPEVLSRSYTEKADLWSLGVVAYMLLCGSTPWHNSDQAAIKMIRAGAPRYSPARFDPLSEGAKDFVKMLLTFDPSTRPSAASALQHPWLCANNKTEKTVSFAFLASLRALVPPKSEVPATSAVGNLSSGELAVFRSDFRAMDRDLDGVISRDDLALALASKGEQAKDFEVETLFAALDLNGDGKITYSDLLSATIRARKQLVTEPHIEFRPFDELVSVVVSDIEAVQQTFANPEADQCSTRHDLLEKRRPMCLEVSPDEVPQEEDNKQQGDVCITVLDSPAAFENAPRCDGCSMWPSAGEKWAHLKKFIKSVMSQGQRSNNSFGGSRPREHVRRQRGARGYNPAGCRRSPMGQSLLRQSNPAI